MRCSLCHLIARFIHSPFRYKTIDNSSIKLNLIHLQTLILPIDRPSIYESSSTILRTKSLLPNTVHINMTGLLALNIKKIQYHHREYQMNPYSSTDHAQASTLVPVYLLHKRLDISRDKISLVRQVLHEKSLRFWTRHALT